MLKYTRPCGHKNKYVTLSQKELKLRLEGFHENVSVAPLLDTTRCPIELKAYVACFSKCL